MCKILGFSDFSKIKKKLEVTEYIGELLLNSERDGFGYAIWDKNKSAFFGERTNESTFSSSLRESSGVNFDFCDVKPSSQNVFGEIDFSNVGPAIFHGRHSTNQKTLVNTHPIVKHGMALIHNGVVTDHGPKYETITTNDSEHVLERYKDSSFEEHLTGYYAFMSIDSEGILHVCRDKTTSLYSSWIDSLNTYIFSTTEENITKVCKALGVIASKPKKLKDDILFTMQDNKILTSRSIHSRGWGYTESRHAQTSLGHSLDDRWNRGSSPSESGKKVDIGPRRKDESYQEWWDRNYTFGNWPE